jgi:16S rRNA (cytosine1402-N4)-methyltransferase
MTDAAGPPPGFSHRPVLVDEVVELLTAVPPGVVIDGTVGGGGHARALLEARADLSVLGLDRDAEAVEAARSALAGFGDRVTVVHAGFEDLDAVAEEYANADVAAVLLDLGVSSHQLDRPERGFSYRADAPLDMRMDRAQPASAADVVNTYPEPDLARVIARYGEERFARAIARRIVRRRPIDTTGELVDVIKDAIPAPARRRGGHPARRTFQALRIEVNRELEHLDRGLDAAVNVITPKGRLAVLSYHSLEDRMVKRRFAGWATGGLHAPGIPTQTSAIAPVVDIVTRRAIRASAREISDNPRSESVRLRVVEKKAVEPMPVHEPPGGNAA